MYDPVHNRIGVDTTAQSAVPVLALVLCTENRGGAVIAALDQLKDEMLFALRHVIEQPFVKDQQTVAAELFQELESAMYIQRGLAEQLHQIGNADISCTVSLHTSLSANGTRKVAFAGAGEPIEYDWLVLFDETAASECQDQLPVKPSLFIMHIHKCCIGNPELGCTDQAVNLDIVLG